MTVYTDPALRALTEAGLNLRADFRGRYGFPMPGAVLVGWRLFTVIAQTEHPVGSPWKYGPDMVVRLFEWPVLVVEEQLGMFTEDQWQIVSLVDPAQGVPHQLPGALSA